MKLSRTPALVLASLAALSITACTEANRATDRAPGHYESTVNSTNYNGTSYKTKQTTDVTVDQYGNKTAVVKTKQTTDPKGLFNKKTTTTKEVVQER